MSLQVSGNSVYNFVVRSFQGNSTNFYTSAPSAVLTWFPKIAPIVYPTNPPVNVRAIPLNVLANGDFELGSLPPWSWIGTGNVDWSTNVAGVVPSSGKMAVVFNSRNLTPNGTISCVVSNLFYSAKYRLTFDLAAVAPGMTQAQTQRIAVTVDGKSRLLAQTFNIQSLTISPWYAYKTFSTTFVADGPGVYLKFTDVSPTTASVDMVLDNVRVVFADN
jgi:hypothetical protein